ncbi:MAG: beta-galactosidase, partial [Planctomycetia bacterium]
MRSIARLIVLALLPTAASAADWRPAPTPLATRWGREVTPDNAWREYPRPQLVREAWQSLNGLWDYAVVDRPAGEAGPPRGDGPPPAAWDGKILVPFCVESSLSGVGRPVTAGQLLWYRRRVAVPAAWSGRRIMLRFDAVDWHATAWLNG